MITAIEIENFKGIGERQRIELKPITLLFGPNSGGKSTIIDALHYLREILEHRNLDADRTISGGESVDLGGFANFVHGRKLNTPLRISVDMDIKAGRLLTYLDPDETPFGFEDCVTQARVSIEVRWSHVNRHPFVSMYSVDINGEPLATIGRQAGRASCELTHFAARHPILKEPQIPEFMTQGPVFVSGQWDALPRLEQPICFVQPSADEKSPAEEGESFTQMGDPDGFAHAGITRLIAGPARLLRDALREMQYLGPLRKAPPRHYVPLRHHDPARRANGLAAWDELHYVVPEVFAEVSDWLSRPDRLATGYYLRRFQTIELDTADQSIVALLGEHAYDEADLEDMRIRVSSSPRRLRLALVDAHTGVKLDPPDVGEGVAQILPVVVALLVDVTGLVVIEQPELHVHPAIQVALGDLLIYAAGWHTEPLIIETHSEHLLLRLLRRIRQTTEGDHEVDDFALKSEGLSVTYMDQHDGAIRATPLRVDETGEFVDRWPKGFFEERAGELF